MAAAARVVGPVVVDIHHPRTLFQAVVVSAFYQRLARPIQFQKVPISFAFAVRLVAVQGTIDVIPSPIPVKFIVTVRSLLDQLARLCVKLPSAFALAFTESTLGFERTIWIKLLPLSYALALGVGYSFSNFDSLLVQASGGDVSSFIVFGVHPHPHSVFIR